MRRWLLGSAAPAVILAMLPIVLSGARKKNEEPKPQVLPLPKELPMAVAVDTERLTFQNTPLLKTGRLSSQIKDSLAYLIRETRGESIVKLRAFVSGAGDSRRVKQLVGEMFSDKKLPLPVLTIVQVGSVGDDAAAVVIEGVVSGKKAANPNGLAFFAGESGVSLNAALAKLETSVHAASLDAGDVLRSTCFAARITDESSMRNAISAAFPSAAINLVQGLREPIDSENTCEAVARLKAPVPEPGHIHVGNSRVFFVTSPQIVFTGMQLSFGTFLDDANSALARLQHDLEGVHVRIADAVMLNAFSLSPAATSALRKTMPKFDVPAETLTVEPVEGLPSLDAALGMEAILVPGRPLDAEARTGADGRNVNPQ
jgi:enamine deaminase RidA (YjgF/YER057c/UK114 family)